MTKLQQLKKKIQEVCGVKCVEVENGDYLINDPSLAEVLRTIEKTGRWIMISTEGKFIDVQGGYFGGWDFEKTLSFQDITTINFLWEIIIKNGGKKVEQLK